MATDRDHEMLMRRALDLAREAGERGEVPVGCVIARGDEILAEASNRREADRDPTGHAEILAIRMACARIGSWRLEGTVLVVSCEPCPMCAGAIVQARVPLVVYGCDDPKGGGVRSRYGIGVDGALNHRYELVSGVLADESASLLRVFFSRLR